MVGMAFASYDAVLNYVGRCGYHKEYGHTVEDFVEDFLFAKWSIIVKEQHGYYCFHRR